MSQVAKHDSPEAATAKVRILVYSDDRNVREKVRFAVGSTTHGREIHWRETATHAAVIEAVESQAWDLLVLDGEAAKVGGMGICRQIKQELYDAPPVLLLVGRQADAWLATWSQAEAAVAHPLDPFVVREAVDSFFAPADQRA